MQDARAQRWLGVAGLVFVVLVVAAVGMSTNASSHATAAKVVASAHQHKGALVASAFVVGLAVIEGLFYFWYLRDYLCEVAANRRLATIAYAGVIMFAVSGAVGAGIRFSMADGVGHVDPVAMQTLNLLQNDLNMFLAAAGTSVFLIANGIALIRNGPLPVWLGWIGVVLGVVAGVFGAPAAALWILIASIVILVRANRTRTSVVPTSP